MKQLSKSENMTILFNEFVLNVYKEFIIKLLETQQVKNKKGYYFKKSSNLPRNQIFLKSFLKAINAFYNLCNYLLSNQIHKIDTNTLYDCLDFSKCLSNDLVEKNTVIPHLKFIKSIGETKNG